MGLKEIALRSPGPQSEGAIPLPQVAEAHNTNLDSTAIASKVRVRNGRVTNAAPSSQGRPFYSVSCNT